MAAARKKGAKEPAIFFIPQKDTVYIYWWLKIAHFITIPLR
jgi:hypothetical protein